MPQRVRIGRRREGRPHLAGPGATYDAGRALHDKPFYAACYAPTVSMYFDQMGDVRACCQNTGRLLGNVRDQSIREIWQSTEASLLRDALATSDFSLGCGFCKWQVDEGGTSPFARDFDRHPVRTARPEWPVQMEFSMTNSCNLQCIMCNGDWSSSIRAHRENRPPLPAVYHDRFFDELAEFLPHLELVNFLGGEPFLGKEPLRVMGMLIDMGLRTPVTVTTNATQWSDRIEQICDALDISFVVSLDGITKSTYESIRVGADFDAVMRNIDRFRQRVDGGRTTVSVAHCLMRPNWREFVDLLLWAEHTDIASVGINSVVYPAELSLYQMREDDLREVVAHMERQDAGPAASLSRPRPVWEEQLERLRNRLMTLQSSGGARVDPWPSGTSASTTNTEVPALSPITRARLEETRRDLAEGFGMEPVVVETRDESVTSVHAPEWASWLGTETWFGHHIDRVAAEIGRTVGDLRTIGDPSNIDGVRVATVEVDAPTGRRTILVHLFVVAETEQRGCFVVERLEPALG